MKKAILRITIIICVNLLAFLMLGHILDALLNADGRMKIYFLIASIPSLVGILWWKMKDIQRELYDISTVYDRNNSNK